MSLISLIKKHKMKHFRRLYMKRRLTTGEYESSWQLISAGKITKYGKISTGIDDIKANFYKTSDLSFEVSNEDGYFGDINNTKSFWNGYMTQYNTFVKLEAGYIDPDTDIEYPTNSTLFVGLLSEDISYKSDGKLSLKAKHLSSIFKDIPADAIAGLGTTNTASEIITKIRDFQDSNSIYIFQKYITSGAWIISTTTQNYNMDTNTTLQNTDCWRLMQKLSEAENYLLNINRSGNFYFINKTEVASSISFHFSGIGDTDKSYGHNLIDYIDVKEDIDNVYNRISIKINDDETTTSYVYKRESWTWGDSSSSFYYGVREYKYENNWITTATANVIATTLYNEYKSPKQKVVVKSKFVPHLSLNDRVSTTYRIQKQSGGDLWGYALFLHSYFTEKAGYNVDLNNGEYKIIKIEHDIDNFESQITLREI